MVLAKRKPTCLPKITHSLEKMDFLLPIIRNMINHKINHNTEFYENCTEYFEFLRKKGDADDAFEDEYFFTMPAISNH